MKTNKVIIKDHNLSKTESRELILNIVNKQIDFLKMEHISKWERDQSISFDETQKKVEELKIKRRQLNELIEKIAQNEDDKLDISLSLEVRCADKISDPLKAFVMQ